MDSRVGDFSRQWWSSNVVSGGASYIAASASYITLYAVLDHLSLVHNFQGLGISLWSPSNGLSVAMLLAYGPKFSPAVFAAIILTDLYVHTIPRDITSIVVTGGILASGYAPLVVRADPIQVEQVLLNLITNAVDAAAARGDGKGLVTIRSGLRDSMAAVSVEDNGTGVAPEIAEHLLELFYTNKPKGMGLGLPLSRQIIEAHGGHLHWTSIEPSGAKFTFELAVAGSDRNVT